MLPDDFEYTPEERAALDSLDAHLDSWATDAAARLDAPAPNDAGPDTRPDANARPRLWGWGALAASLVGLLLLRGPSPAPPADPLPPDGTEGVALAAHDLDVESPGAFMIVPTRNPSISIVWLLDTDPEPGD